MKRSAFTMLELVLVIVVLGILAALSLPRMHRDLRQEAADNVLSAIRYTQHLALLDDKQSFNNPKWQQEFWHIYFGTCDDGLFYAIGSDRNDDGANNGHVDFDESALDPANGKHIWGHDGTQCEGGHPKTEISPNIFIGKKYGIKTFTEDEGCPNQFIGFDHLGRPYSKDFGTSTVPDNRGYMTSECTFTFTLSDDTNFSINIEPETGYAYIVGQEDS